MLADQLKNRTGRVYGYARVSTADQKLRVQRDALNAIKVDRIFEDKASGAKTKRRGLDAVLSTVQRGDTLVVFRLDRLGRSVLHLSQLLSYFQENGIGFVSLTEGIVILPQ